MADKLRRTQPLNISFSDGEQPSSAKLTAIATQSRIGSSVLERAIGDLWNQSGEPMLIDYPNQIPNLARMIGENRYLNPAWVNVTDDFEFDEHIGTRNPGEVTGYLNWAPKDGTTPSGVSGSQFGNGSRKNNEYEVGDPLNGDVQPNEWFASSVDGKFRVNSVLAGTEVVRYTIDPTTWELSNEVLPGVIPDPRQVEFTSCRVEFESGRYLLHLPPRRPLTFSSFGNGFEGEESKVSKYPNSSEISDSNNFATTTATPFKYWQAYTDSGTLALSHNHYRYKLPNEILNNYNSIDEGTEFPRGYFYIYNKSTKTIIDDVVFTKPVGTGGAQWIIEVSSSEFDFSTVATADESEASYNTSNLVLITCGSPLARTLWQTSSKLLNHQHDNTGDHTTMMLHSSLKDVNPPTSDYDVNDHDSRYPTYLPHWSSSRWEKDDHVYLLSRAGSQGTSSSRRRDPNDNAMLGHLVIANSVPDSDNIFLDPDVPNNSFKIAFGSLEGASIQNTTSGLEVIQTVNGATGLHVQAGPGNSTGLVVNSLGNLPTIYAKSLGTGPSIILDADSSTPNRGPLVILPQDTDPASPVVGECYVNSESGLLSTYRVGSTWSRLRGLIHKIQTPATVAGSGITGEFTLATYVLPANSIRSGDTTIEIIAMGQLAPGGSGTGNTSVTLRANATTIGSTTVRTYNSNYRFSIRSIVRHFGGTLWFFGATSMFGSGSIGVETNLTGDNFSADPTADITFTLVGSTADSTREIRVDHFYVIMSD